MRRFLLAAVIFGAASGAQAADMPDLPILRGIFAAGLSRRTVNWEGVYVGGQAGYGSGDMDFRFRKGSAATSSCNNIDAGKAVQYLKLAALRQDVDPEQRVRRLLWAITFSGTMSSMASNSITCTANSSDPLAVVRADRSAFPTDYQHVDLVSSSSSMNITDFGSFRARAGYAFGTFLPYAFAGRRWVGLTSGAGPMLDRLSVRRRRRSRRFRPCRFSTPDGQANSISSMVTPPASAST